MQNFTPLNLNKFKAADKEVHHVFPAQHSEIVRRPSYLPQIVFATALLLTIGVSVYFFQQNKLNQRLLTQATFDNSQPLVDLIGRLVVLPQNEVPTIATVSDSGQLPDQPFFKNAQNGDKILVYTNAKKAILYRPSLNKIVEMGPVVEPSANEDVSGASTSSATIRTSLSPTTTPKVIFNPATTTTAPTEIILDTSLSPSPTTSP